MITESVNPPFERSLRSLALVGTAVPFRAVAFACANAAQDRPMKGNYFESDTPPRSEFAPLEALQSPLHVLLRHL